MSRPQKARIALALIGLLLVSGLAGCTALDEYELPEAAAAPTPEIPTRMIDLWTFTVLTQEGLPGVCGFGGRVMFYNDKDEKPVAVDVPSPSSASTRPAATFPFPRRTRSSSFRWRNCPSTTASRSWATPTVSGCPGTRWGDRNARYA